jgi:hypothetical protein
MGLLHPDDGKRGNGAPHYPGTAAITLAAADAKLLG